MSVQCTKSKMTLDLQHKAVVTAAPVTFTAQIFHETVAALQEPLQV